MIAASPGKNSIRIAVAGVLYFVIGYGSTLLDHPFSGQVHFWRLAAWIASAVVYLTHLSHEYFRLRRPPLSAASRVALAVAAGGFLLAVQATAHAAMVYQHAPYGRLLIAWIAWPLITGVPAFLFAVVVTTILRWLGIPHLAET